MTASKSRLSHCPTLLGVGTMGQGTAETGRTEWDTWDKRDAEAYPDVCARAHQTTGCLYAHSRNPALEISRSIAVDGPEPFAHAINNRSGYRWLVERM
jgi:hypothetical protein